MMQIREGKRSDAQRDYIGLSELVWAKVDGHPWWPAIVISIHSDDKYRVDFVGHPSHAFVTRSKLAPYSHGCPHPLQRKLFSKTLLRAIAAADALQPSPAPLSASSLSSLARVEDSSSLYQLKQSPRTHTPPPSPTLILQKYQLQTIPPLTLKPLPKPKKKHINKPKAKSSDAINILLLRRINALTRNKGLSLQKRAKVARYLTTEIGHKEKSNIVLKMLKWLHMSNATVIEQDHKSWMDNEMEREEKDKNSVMSCETLM